MKNAIKGYRVIPTFFSNFGRTCPSLTPDDQLLFPQGTGLCVTSGSIDFTLHQMLTARSFLDEISAGSRIISISVASRFRLRT